jgi:ribosome-interacting GTPase 1
MPQAYILGNRVYTSCIYVMNKIDQISIEELDLIYKVPHAGKFCFERLISSADISQSWLEL